MQRTIQDGKINVAVIGAGTGLTTAWILECQGQFNVSVFEAQDRLGGHINTVVLDGKKVEAGAEFIGNELTYPNTHQLFRILGVALEPFELNMVFQNLNHPNNKLVIPPIMHTSHGSEYEVKTERDEENTSCFSAFTLFSRGKRNFQRLDDSAVQDSKKRVIQPDRHISIHTLTKDIRNVINLYLVIQQAKKELHNSVKFMTLEDFIQDFISHCPEFIGKRNQFAEEILYAVIAAGWGAPIDTVKKFNAKYAMQYLTAGKIWFDAPDGLSSYIQKLEAESTHATIERSVKVKRLIPILVDGKLKYQMLCNNGRYIENEDGSPACYDDVIITTPAYASHKLIADIDVDHLAELIENADSNEKEYIMEAITEIETLRELLKQVDYFNTTVVFHQDQSYECSPNAVMHTRFDGRQAANTSCKRWKYAVDEVPILKTWVLPGQSMPENVLHVEHYRHPVIDKRYYDAQQALHRAQTKLGLHFGGILSGSSDSHESGLTASLEIAARLCLRENCLTENARLAHFPNVIKRLCGDEKMDIKFDAPTHLVRYTP